MISKEEYKWLERHTDILNKIESAKTEIMTAPEQQHKDILDAISASIESVIDSHTKTYSKNKRNIQKL